MKTYPRGSALPIVRRARTLGCILILSSLAACSEGVPVDVDAAIDDEDAGMDTGVEDSGADTGLPDTGVADAGVDASVPACTGDAPAALFADRVAADGTAHWLRRTPTASTYAVVPAGAPRRSALPRLYAIAQFCGDQSVLILEDASSQFSRVDYVVGSSLHVCVSSTTFASAAAAFAAPSADAATYATVGCAGHPFTPLTQ